MTTESPDRPSRVEQEVREILERTEAQRSPIDHFGESVQRRKASGPPSGAAVRIGQKNANIAAEPASTSSGTQRQPRRHSASSASARAAVRNTLGSR